MTSTKPFKLIRHYTRNNVTTTYDQYFTSMDGVYKSLRKVIDHCVSYTFEQHKMIAHNIDNTLTLELRNQQLPKLINLNEVMFANSPKLKKVEGNAIVEGN